MANRFLVKFTNGERRAFFAPDVIGARERAYVWLCAYRPWPAAIHIMSVEVCDGA
jgi:hypothetical protein